MKRTSHDIIIIGGGAGGLTAASGCAQLGMRTLLIEKGQMGGDCLHYGCVPSKSLLKSASLFHSLGHFEDYGLPPVSSGPVDLKPVMARVKSVIETIAYHDSVERFESLGAMVITGSPRFISPHEIKVAGKTYSGIKIVIATGSSPASVSIPGLEDMEILTNKTIFDLDELPNRLITIGGGPIGVELSQAFQRLGSAVTLLNRGSHVLGKEDEDMARIVQDKLIEEGMRIENGTNITGVNKDNDGIILDYEQGGKTVSLRGDRILLAAGRKGNTEDLNLEQAGITNPGSFIPVNDKLQTSQKHIYAIGDVNGQFLFTHVAGAEGSYVVRHAALKLPGHFSYERVPWSTYCDPELASVGLNEKRANLAGMNYSKVMTGFDELDRAQAEGRTKGKIKVLIDRKDRLLGCQIAGPEAGNLILPALYGLAKGYKLSDILSPILPYPTLGEIQKKNAGAYYGPKLFNPRVRNILRLLYHYRG